MPNKDKTGPNGQGPLTGRGLGICGNGMQKGYGMGFGRGCRWGYQTPITLTKEEEKKILEANLKNIEAEKEAIQNRLKEI
jgi:hypothetical protein